MQLIKGGFALNKNDELILNTQRALTAYINANFIQVGATFLNVSSKSPYSTDWYKRKFKDTNLQQWIDDPDHRALNLGFNLQFGWLDVDIDSGDPQYNKCIIEAMRYLQIDTRFAFGRRSKGVPSHVLVQLAEHDIQNYDMMKEFEPKEFKLSGERYKTELRSTGVESEVKVKQSRQTVMPGSIYTHRNDPGNYDISVWYTSDFNVAVKIEELAETTPHKTRFAQLIMGVAFGTFVYIILPHWSEGTRQQSAIKLAGWLARIVTESKGMNEHDSVSPGVFCPCDRAEVAEAMLDFLCKMANDDESYMRKRAFRDALQKLDNNPDAHIPGWPAIEGMIGTESMLALRAVFMPGIDVSPLTQMADNYIYDDSDDSYIDRTRFKYRMNYIHDGAQLDRRHENEFMNVAGKMKPLFRIFRTSQLRRRVSMRELYPDLPAGTVFRVSNKNELLPDDQADPTARTVFNTWSGWPYEAALDPNPELLTQCNEFLDKLFGYLTQDNKAQADWLKQWLAWTVQFPGQKQQIAPVIVGGQGVGKSFFGNILLGQLFQDLWGSASPRILEGNFSVEPFINKMFVFIDEAKFYNESSTDEIKKIIRSDRIGGAEKFKTARTYNVYARVVFASNKYDINIGQQNVQDRALFHMKSYDREYLKMTEQQFQRWAVTLKPFFNDMSQFIARTDVKEHLMYLFKTMEVDKSTVESTALSSSNDSNILEANMSYPRRVAKRIIEEGNIWEDVDISAPFTMLQFEARVNEVAVQMGLRQVVARRVFDEFRTADLVGQVICSGQKLYRFRYKIGSLTEAFGLAIGVDLEPRFVFTEDDFGPNDCTEINKAPAWKGRNTRFRNSI